MSLLRKRVLYALIAIAVLLASIPLSVSAAHCSDLGEPGNSDFSFHVRAAGHAEGAHYGWATCEPQANPGGNSGR